jgi:hypothetical protein
VLLSFCALSLAGETGGWGRSRVPRCCSPDFAKEYAGRLQLGVSRERVYDVLGGESYSLRDRPLHAGESPAISAEEHTLIR